MVVEAYKNSNRGVRVARVIEGKPAEAAGILEEDMIHRIGDVEVHSHPDFRKALKVGRPACCFVFFFFLFFCVCFVCFVCVICLFGWFWGRLLSWSAFHENCYFVVV